MDAFNELQGDLANMGVNIPSATQPTAPMGAPTYLTALNALDALCQWRETEVELPLLKTKVIMKPIKGLEELRLNSLKASGETFLRSFNEILYNHVDFQGKIKFNDFEDFLAHLSSADKSLMVFGLLFATYPNLGEREFKCPYCEQLQVHDIRPDELLHDDTIPKKWSQKGSFTNFREELEIMPGFTIKIGFQTEADSLKLLSIVEDKEIKDNIDEKGSIFDTLKLFIMFIKEIRIQPNPNDPAMVLTDMVKEIYPFIMGLKNIMILENLINKISDYEEISKYQPNFYAVKNCTNLSCGKEFKWMVNPEVEFFRKASAFYDL